MRLKINGLEVDVGGNASILDAARSIGVAVPTLCFREEIGHFASCMVCVVKDVKAGRLTPACSARVVEGMEIETDSPEVLGARRKALDMLLGVHVGDCEAPCTRGCPAHMDIPRMIRELARGDFRSAVETVKDRLALPAVLGRICPAPCEKACRRGRQDEALSIRLLNRFAADIDLFSGSPWLPTRAALSGRRIAIVGSGPAGLAAAYYLLRWGHDCEIYEERSEPGGMLRFGVPEGKLPRDVLKAEIGLIERLGARFCLNVSVGSDVALEELRREHDAVVLAAGKLVSGDRFPGVECGKDGVLVARDTLRTNIDGIFAAGDIVRATRLAVRSVGDGRSAAYAVHQMLSGLGVVGCARRFDSRIGKLGSLEMAEFAAEAVAAPAGTARKTPGGDGFSEEDCMAEAARCMHCDCRKKDDCRLRLYADEYKADARRLAGRDREAVLIAREHPEVVFESGKCIRCGLCVAVTRLRGERVGLAFMQRGYKMRIGVPFDEGLDRAIETCWRECVEVCPTGAFALRTAR